MKKFLILLFFLYISFSVFSQTLEYNGNYLFLGGSNIYVRIFMFYFPLSKKYEVFLNTQKDYFNLDIQINQNDLKKEPFTPSYFDSELLFIIKNIPYKKSGRITLPITIRCNKKFIEKEVVFTVFFKENILIINGFLNDIYIKEITGNEYFKKRLNWKYPLYFDIRIQINDPVLDEINANY